MEKLINFTFRGVYFHSLETGEHLESTLYLYWKSSTRSILNVKPVYNSFIADKDILESVLNLVDENINKHIEAVTKK